jgi:hypothetical protein
MRIYNKVTISIDTGEILEEDSYQYSGEVAQCKGGGSTTTTVDPAYNARMASISERQQEMAEELFEWHKTYEQPIQEAQLGIKQELYEQTEFSNKMKGLAMDQLDIQKRAAEEAKRQGLPEKRAQITGSFYEEALKGVDPEQRADQAATDVANQFAGRSTELRREMGRMGIQPGGSRGLSALSDDIMERNRAVAGAKAAARTQAEGENFSRLSAAAGMGPVNTTSQGTGGFGLDMPSGSGGSGGSAADRAIGLMGQAQNLGKPGHKTTTEPPPKTIGGGMMAGATTAAAGAAYGAMEGTAVSPGWGTVIGAGIGLLGYMLS